MSHEIKKYRTIEYSSGASAAFEKLYNINLEREQTRVIDRILDDYPDDDRVATILKSRKGPNKKGEHSYVLIKATISKGVLSGTFEKMEINKNNEKL